MKNRMVVSSQNKFFFFNRIIFALAIIVKSAVVQEPEELEPESLEPSDPPVRVIEKSISNPAESVPLAKPAADSMPSQAVADTVISVDLDTLGVAPPDSARAKDSVKTPDVMQGSIDTSGGVKEVLEIEPVKEVKKPEPTQDILEVNKEGYTAKDDFSVNIDTTQSANVNKSVWLAIGLSSVLPGTGELYLKDKMASKTFILTEIGFWGTLWIALMAQESYLQSSRHYAAAYGGLKNDNPSDELLTAMTQYRSYQEVHHCKCSYEQIQILSGHRDGDYDIPAREENYWDFGTAAVPENTENWKTFIATTKNFGRAKIVATWAIGGLLLGRVASTLNTLHLYRTTSVKGLSHKKNSRNSGKTAGKSENPNTVSASADNTPLTSVKLWIVPEILPGHTGASLRLMF